MQELMQERSKIASELNKALSLIKTRGLTLANTEREYKVANAKAIRIMKAEGLPATLILELCKGDEEVANLRFDRDSAQVMYKSALEAVNIKKIELRVLEEDIK